MSELDYKYIAKLVDRTRMGDSDSFAELYAATIQKQYRFACRYLKEEYLAQDALQEVYILVYKNLDHLRDPRLFIPWLNQLTFRICFRIQQEQMRYEQEISRYIHRGNESSGDSSDNIAEQEELLKQILDLPYPESQTLVMKYYHHMDEDEIAMIMEVHSRTVNRYIQRGKQKLGHILREN